MSWTRDGGRCRASLRGEGGGGGESIILFMAEAGCMAGGRYAETWCM
jgi:hypothetical protein